MAVNQLTANSAPVATTTRQTQTAGGPTAAAQPTYQPGASGVSGFDRSSLDAKSGQGAGTVNGIPDTSGFDYDPARVALYEAARSEINSDKLTLPDGREDLISKCIPARTADRIRTQAYEKINAVLSNPDLNADQIKAGVAEAVQWMKGQVFVEKGIMDGWWGMISRHMNENLNKLKEI